ncbi:MAG: CPBP family intramembrane metalloprotease [Propionibacteriaceae bacterium]|jgi:membrane protease YdiL (CAAX protease family)|nr:CPBP family intramembrane metalloprotease [Propionibacteriaceae bacterium]
MTEQIEEGTVPELPTGRIRPGYELVLVLGISLGQSAVYSILSLLNKLTYQVPLNQQTTSMNNSVTPDRPWLDLLYQLAGIVFPMVPAFLALYLLKLTGDRAKIGFDLKRPGFDIGWGFGLAACIGIPGLGLFAVAKLLGLQTSISASNLAANWWTIPVLLGLALMNGVLEEIVMIAYLFDRLRKLKWKWVWIVVLSAGIRGTYHLYQGFGSFLGNFIMGVVFGVFYLKTRRVGALVATHFVLDAVSFVGYPLAAPWLAAWI